MAQLNAGQRVDPLYGRVKPYAPLHHPFKRGLAQAHERIHLVIPASSMLGSIPMLASYNYDDKMSVMRSGLYTFIVAAISNAAKHRGSDAPRLYQGDNPRFSVLLTYIPKHIYASDESDAELLSREQLIDPKNLAALMVTVALHDAQLSIAEALADQMDINRLGDVIRAPKRAANGKPKPAAAKGGDRRRGGGWRAGGGGDAESDEDSSEIMSEAYDPLPGDADYPDAEPDAGDAADESRMDIPGRPLDQGQYRFLKTESWKKASLSGHHPLYAHMQIKKLRHYANVMSVCALGDGSPTDPAFSSDSRRLSDRKFETHPFHPTVAWTLENALAQISMLPGVSVDLQLTTAKNWFDPDEQSFGSPYVKVGGVRVKLEISSLLEPEDFTVDGYLYDQLPHMIELRQREIQARVPRNPLEVRTGPNESYRLDDLMARSGFVTASEHAQRVADAHKRPDVLDKHFSELWNASVSIEALRERDPVQWAAKKTQLYQQGRDWLEQLLHGYTFNTLPKGMRAVVTFLNQLDRPQPVSHMIQSARIALPPFCQMVIKDMLCDSTLLSAADGGVATVRDIWIAACSVGLPKIGVERNKLNIQIVGPAATSKSHTLSVASKKLIPGTVNPISGTSTMGGIRIDESERLLDAFEELPPQFTPHEEVLGVEQRRTHAMTLTKLSEGQVNYKTMGKQLDEQGYEQLRLIDSSADYTNAIVGCTNPIAGHLNPDGPAQAIMTRFEMRILMTPVDKVRGKVVENLARPFECNVTAAGQQAIELYQYLHGVVMLYGAALASYAVPLPGMHLFADLFPKAIDHLTDLRPEVGGALRQMSRLKTKCMVEVISFAARMAALSPLSPRFAELLRDQTDLRKLSEETLPDNPRFVDLLPEIARYCYLTYDIFVFVMSACANELLGGYNFLLLRNLVKAGDYLIANSASHDFVEPWPVQPPHTGDASHDAYEAAWGDKLFSKMDLGTFTAYLKSYEQHTYLMVPATSRQAESRKKFVDGREAEYQPYDLASSKTAPTERSDVGVQFVIGRRDFVRPPAYKYEVVDGKEYLNPNYICATGTIDRLCRTANSKMGNVVMSQTQIKSMLLQMRSQQMFVPYLPCIPIARGEGGKLRAGTIPGNEIGLNRLQSMRSSRWAMSQFNVHKVPMFIEDHVHGVCYILIAAAEMDIYSICRDMVDKLCYSGSPERRLLFNMPAQSQFRQYETYQMRRQPNVQLKIERRNQVTEADRMMLSDFKQHLIDEPAVRVYGEDEDIEELHALYYLRTADPNANEEELRAYTPRGIHRRLYGQHGYYRLHPEELFTVPYPHTSSLNSEESRAERLEEERRERERRRMAEELATTAEENAARARAIAMALDERAREQQRLRTEQMLEDDAPDDDDGPSQGFFKHISREKLASSKVIHLPSDRVDSAAKRQQLVSSNSGLGWSLSNNNSKTAVIEPNPFEVL